MPKTVYFGFARMSRKMARLLDKATSIMDQIVIPWRPPRRTVLQHNALAEAKYRLSVRAQKLLIMLLAQLDQRVDDFTDIKLFLRDFAKLTSGYPGDVRYTEFVDAAKQFMGRFVSITQPHVPGEKEARGLICHWISSIEKNPNEKSMVLVQSLNSGPIWQASDSLSPRAPGSTDLFLKFAPEPLPRI